MTKQRWRKRGRIYAPDGGAWWARRYATLPTVEVLDERTLRAYFASLDERNYGRIGFVDLDARDPGRILGRSPEPVLDIGPPGSFDDCGVNPSCAVTIGGRRHLYYIGWQRCERVPYMLFTGLAAVAGGSGSFERVSRVPVLDRTGAEPYSRSAPFVMPAAGGFRMWYWSCLQWSEGEEGLHYNNVIRHATSADGIHWDATETICLAPEGREYSLGRPWVVQENGLYRMWFSVRSEDRPYRLGYAESRDGIGWERKDFEVGIHRSESGWDSEMVCYPCVVDAAGNRYLFYNGNRHGASGFGYAVLEQE